MKTQATNPPLILVAEDEELMRAILKGLLAEAGYRVAAVETAEAALERFAAEEVSVTLTDIRMAGMDGLEVRSIASDRRKDPSARREMMASVDLVVLCLPDDAAKEAVALATELGEKAPRIVDASSAHRVTTGWVYGFAELVRDQPRAIREARLVTNPGCYPTGAIGLLRPLVDAGVIPAEYPSTINAVSGYSGGGKAMIGMRDDLVAVPVSWSMIWSSVMSRSTSARWGCQASMMATASALSCGTRVTQTPWLSVRRTTSASRGWSTTTSTRAGAVCFSAASLPRCVG